MGSQCALYTFCAASELELLLVPLKLQGQVKAWLNQCTSTEGASTTTSNGQARESNPAGIHDLLVHSLHHIHLGQAWLELPQVSIGGVEERLVVRSGGGHFLHRCKQVRIHAWLCIGAVASACCACQHRHSCCQNCMHAAGSYSPSACTAPRGLGGGVVCSAAQTPLMHPRLAAQPQTM